MKLFNRKNRIPTRRTPKQWIIRIVMVRFIYWYKEEPPSIAISNAQIFWFIIAIVIASTVKILQVTDVLGVWVVNAP